MPMARHRNPRNRAAPARSKKPRIEEPVSAGGVVFRTVDGRLETILCGRDNRIRWSLAKVTPDPGETMEQTALREVREETGLEVRIEEPIRSIDYWFADRTVTSATTTPSIST